jgi:hypothetical protein
MLVKQTPWLVPPRASATPQADNLRPALTTQQISPDRARKGQEWKAVRI